MTQNQRQAWKQRFAIFIATAFGAGFLPKVPGTWGSLLGLAFVYSIQNLISNKLGLLLFISIFSLFALWTIRITEQAWKTHDDKKIVIDEVVGQFIACMWFSPTPIQWGLAFLFFRFFDIIKPPPVGWIDKFQHSFATLMDDVVAGIMAAIVLWVLNSWFF